MLEEECARPDDFYEQLILVELQAERIENNNFDLVSNKMIQLVRERATVLMTGVVEFLNCALIYFSCNFAGRSFLRNADDSQVGKVTWRRSSYL